MAVQLDSHASLESPFTFGMMKTHRQYFDRRLVRIRDHRLSPASSRNVLRKDRIQRGDDLSFWMELMTLLRAMPADFH